MESEMADKKPGGGGQLPRQTGTTEKGRAQPGGAEAKPVTPKPGMQTKKK
jgi:hypothetical protein